MRAKEAIRILKAELSGLDTRSYLTGAEMNTALAIETAIEALEKLQRIETTVYYYETRYPYKVSGNCDSYSSWREGVADLISGLDPILWPRGFTEEEAAAYEKAVNEIYKPTGININDLIDKEVNDET